jgi:two-component system, LytTR family, response regulator
MKILMIEDEMPAARQLAALLTKIRPDWQVLTVLDSVSASVEYLKGHSAPDLIFMDIQLADGLSFSIFEQVNIGSEVIFCTAFDQYAIEAFKRHAVHYLLKPVAEADLQDACERFEAIRPQHPQGNTALAEIVQKLSIPVYKERFLVKTGQQLAFIETPQIAWFRSAGGLTEAWLPSGKRYIVDHTLDELEHLLDPKAFFRVSRQYYIGTQCMQKITPHLNSRIKLDLLPNPQEEVFVSRERVAAFKTWLGG